MGNDMARNQQKARPINVVTRAIGALVKAVARAKGWLFKTAGQTSRRALALWPKEGSARLRTAILLVLGAVALMSSLVPVLWMGQKWGELLLGFGTNMAGAVATYVLIDLLIRPREASEAKKSELIAQLGSKVHDVAIAAAEELRRRKWLYDGTLEGARLWEANLQGAQLRRASLRKVRLGYANLQQAELPEANLEGAILTEADLRGAYIMRANLRETSLSGANLQGALLQEADLERAVLTRAKLLGADLRGVNLRGAEIDETTEIDNKWQQVWRIVNQGAVGADLHGARLSPFSAL